jgi:iron(III) transport system permease protein
MTVRRAGPGLVLLALAAPLAFAFATPLRDPAGWAVWAESARLATLAGQSAMLACGAVAIAVPLGTALAVVLARVPVFGSRALRAALILSLFVPLPVVAVAWQIVLGSWLPNLALDPGQVAWRPWRQGLVPAAFVHGLAGVPWVSLIVTSLLRRTDPGLEDAARSDDGERAVWRYVLVPRLVPAMALAAAAVAVTALTEIPVTDAMMVRTYAEEVYAELVGNPAGVASAVAATGPVWLTGCVLALVVSSRLGRTFPAAGESVETPSPAGPPSPGGSLLAWVIAMVALGLPFAALVGRAGDGFRPGAFVRTVSTQLREGGGVIVESLLAAAVAGVVAATLAWFCAVSLGRTRRGGRVLLVVCVALWLAPGPIVGLGLKEFIFRLLDLEEAAVAAFAPAISSPPLRALLYDRPSPVPGMWASVMRFFPLAVAAILPAVRAVPSELWDQARLDGLGVRSLLSHLLVPLTGPAVVRAAVGVAALALGEVSAGKLVTPPGQRTYVLDLFNQMHYGAEATVAGLCLVQVAMTAGLLGAIPLFVRSNLGPRAVS